MVVGSSQVAASGEASAVRLDDLFFHAASVRGGAPAIRSLAGERSYAEMATTVHARRRQLVGSISTGDVVVIHGLAFDDVISCYWATLALDAVAVPWCRQTSVTDLTADAVVGVVNASVVIDGGSVQRLGSPPAWTQQTPKQPAVVLLTAGTTGQPKAIVHSHQSLAWGVWNLVSIIDEVMLGSCSVPTDAQSLDHDLRARSLTDRRPMAFYTGMPWDTIAGLTMLHRALILGDVLVRHGGTFDLNELVELGAGGALENLALSPFMAQALLRSLRSSDVTTRALAGIVGLGIGGAQVSPGLVSEAEERLGCITTVGYGSTEAGGALATGRPMDPLATRATTVGRPFASVRLRLEPPVGSVTSQDREPAVGKIFAKTPASMLGTLMADGLEPAGEWLDTGDLGRRDEEGNIRVDGRSDHVIVRAGRRIDPSQIEAALEAHPAIDRAAIVGAPSRVQGEHDVVALVIASRHLTAGQVRRHANEALGLALTPQRVHFVDELPLTPDGAIRRHLVAGLIPSGLQRRRAEPWPIAVASGGVVSARELRSRAVTDERPGRGPIYHRYAGSVLAERSRLFLLSQAYDTLSRSRLSRVPLREGDRCLEVGAGCGSIAMYLAGRVGPSGYVLATDLVPEVMTCAGASIEKGKLDVGDDEIPGPGWQLVYGRAVLHLISGRRLCLRRLAEATAVGGSVVVETFDLGIAAAADQGPLGKVWQAMVDGGRMVDTEPAWFPALVEDMSAAGLSVLSAETSAVWVPGGSVPAQYWDASIVLARPFLGDLLDEQVIESSLQQLRDTTSWSLLPSLAWCWAIRVEDEPA